MARSRYALLLSLATCALSGCSSIAHNTDIVRLNLGGDMTRAAQLTQDGIRRYQKGHIARAEAAFQKAIDADETHGPAHNNLGLLYFDQRDLYQAAWSFERAMEFMPEHAEPANNLGLTYEAAGRLNQAIEMYYLAHEIDPTNAECLGNLTRAQIRRGNRDDTVRYQLQQLLIIDTRPTWIEWAEDQLALVFDKQRQRSDSNLGGDGAGTPDELLPTPLRQSPATPAEPMSDNAAPNVEIPAPVELNIPSGPPTYRLGDE